MILHLFAFCRNEEKLLPFFLQHYRPWVTWMTFFDMGSTDKTVQLLAQEPKVYMVEESPIARMDDASMAYVASLVFFQKGFTVVTKDPNYWILWVDCDEFLHPMSRVVEACHSNTPFRPEGYQMLAPEFPPDYNRPLVQQVKRGVRDDIYDKACLFRLSDRPVFRPGRHRSNKDYPVTGSIKLLHYRYFGNQYLQERNERNYLNMSDDNKQQGRGFQVYPEYKSGKYSGAWYASRLAAAEEII